MYCSALLFIKMTFLLQYYRILGIHRMRYYVYLASMVIVGGWALPQALVGIFTCTPVSAFWDPSVRPPGGAVHPGYPTMIHQRGRQHRHRRHRAGPTLTRALAPALAGSHQDRPAGHLQPGLLHRRHLGRAHPLPPHLRRLPLGERRLLSLWSLGELTSALTCACLLILRPLVARVAPALSALPTLMSVAAALVVLVTTRLRDNAELSTWRSGGFGQGTGGGGGGGVRRWERRGSGAKESRSSGSSGRGGDGSVSLSMSKADLGTMGFKGNSFEVYVMREVSVDVERQQGPAGRDCVAQPERAVMKTFFRE